MSSETPFERVFRLVAETGLRYRDFADGIGVSSQVVGNWRQRGNVPPDRLPAIAAWLSRQLRRSITVDYLHRGQQAAPAESPSGGATENIEIDARVIEWILDAVDSEYGDSPGHGLPNRDVAQRIAYIYPKMIKDMRADYRSRIQRYVSAPLHQLPDNEDHAWQDENERGNS